MLAWQRCSGLMETVPTDVDLPDVVAELRRIDGVEDAHHVHAWALTTGRNLFSAHLLVADDTDPRRALAAAQSLVRGEFDFYFSTIQIETECEEDHRAAAIDYADTDHDDRAGATTPLDPEYAWLIQPMPIVANALAATRPSGATGRHHIRKAFTAPRPKIPLSDHHASQRAVEGLDPRLTVLVGVERGSSGFRVVFELLGLAVATHRQGDVRSSSR